MTRNGTPMQRLRDRQRVSVAPERVAYLRERGLEVAVEEAAVAADAAQADATEAQDTVDGALAGTEAFAALNVGGTDVKPFLDRTDGDKLTDSAGLAPEVVVTEAIAATAVSSTEDAFSLSSISLNTTSQVTVQQFTVDIEDGDELIVIASAAIRAVGVGGGTRGDFINRPTLTLYRGTTYLGGTRPLSVLRDMELHASASLAATDSPPTGTHTIYLYSDLPATTDIATLTADNRFLGCIRRRQNR